MSENKNITERDDRGNVIYEKIYLHYVLKSFAPNAFIEHWYVYDDKNNWVYWKRSDGHEVWYEYENGNRIDITEQKLKERNFLNREQTSRFELMDI